MQDMSSEACAEAPLNKPKALMDNRDQNTYVVARIQNKTNNAALCWMTQNLRLVGSRVLTPDNSDITSNYTLPESVTISSGDTTKRFTTSDQYQSMAYYAGDIAYGTYYNWYTATAGTGASSIISDTTNANGGSSICPKGWRLPTGGNNGEFYQLLNEVTASDVIKTPYNLVYGGYVTSSTLYAAGGEGRYWSAMAGSTSNAYSLFFNSSNVTPSSNLSRYYGLPVRCVAR